MTPTLVAIAVAFGYTIGRIKGAIEEKARIAKLLAALSKEQGT